jgi:methylenetetrahydrofolate reductase (NADPH)
MARIVDLLAAGRTFSFEFFPPKSDAGWLTLGRTIADLEKLAPSFVSVTYGAGGSTRASTHEFVTWIRRETHTTPMAHLTCQSHTHDEIADILDAYEAAGVENILALGGDPPTDPSDARPSDFRYASELVEQVRTRGAYSVGVAAHPHGHPRSPDLATDRRHLAAKLSMADFAMTQFFFDVSDYVRLVDELAALGCDRPVLPGIMPVTNLAQVQRMAQLSGTPVPTTITDRLAGASGPEDAHRIGVDMAIELCGALLEAGAPGLHFYTLNRSPATREIYAELGLPTH